MLGCESKELALSDELRPLTFSLPLKGILANTQCPKAGRTGFGEVSLVESARELGGDMGLPLEYTQTSKHK